MLDVIARLLLSAGILVGTTYLPVLSQAVTAAPAAPQLLAAVRAELAPLVQRIEALEARRG